MIVLVLILLGLALGSFVNAWVWRVHKQSTLASKQARRDYSIVHGRSMCTHCKHALAAKDLIPVVSWLSLRGRCRYCSKPIQDTPVAELLTPVLFVLSYVYWSHAWDGRGIMLFVFWLLYLTGFVMLSIYDIRWHLLPNKVLLLLSTVLLGQVLVDAVFFGLSFTTIAAMIGGVGVGGGIFWCIFQVSAGKWIGGGDVKLGAFLGALVGSPLMAAMVLFAASLIGTFVALPLMAAKHMRAKSQLPFGPFLLASTILVVLFGASLWQWYRRQLGL